MGRRWLGLGAALALAGCDGSASDMAALQEQIDALSAELEAVQSQLDGLGGGFDDPDLQEWIRGVDERFFELERESATEAWVESQLEGLATEAYVDDAIRDLPTSAELLGLLQGTVEVLAADLTLSVPADGTLPELLASLDAVRIPTDRTVTIDIADGQYALDAPVALTHPDGARIEIVGNTGSPGSVVLAFSGGAGGVVVEDGHALGRLDGVRLQGDGTGSDPGVHARFGGHIRLGPDVIVAGFGGDGVCAEGGGSIVARGVTASGNGGHGFHARGNAFIEAEGATATDNEGAGFVAASGASMVAAGAVATGSGLDGFASTGGASLSAGASEATGNGTVAPSAGYSAWGGALLYADASVSTGQDHGYWVGSGSTLLAEGSAAVDSASAGYQAWLDALLVADDASVSGSTGAGVDAAAGSVIHAEGASVSGASGGGFAAGGASLLLASGATARSNGGRGFEADGNSTILATGSATEITTAEDNGDAGFYLTDGAVLRGSWLRSSGNVGDALRADDGAVALAGESELVSNGGGVRIDDASYADLGGSRIDGNGAGLSVRTGSTAAARGAVLTGTVSGDGVRVERMAVVDLEGAVVTGHLGDSLDVRTGGGAFASGATVNDTTLAETVDRTVGAQVYADPALTYE